MRTGFGATWSAPDFALGWLPAGLGSCAMTRLELGVRAIRSAAGSSYAVGARAVRKAASIRAANVA